MATPLDPLQSAADEAIKSWPDVRARNVFGHRGYVRGGKMFAFIADDGLSFKAANGAEAEELYAAGRAKPFIAGADMVMHGWPVLPLATDEHLAEALSAAREAYEGVAG
jgi:TfoX/Sxy family transcriptional regulator of competence genes